MSKDAFFRAGIGAVIRDKTGAILTARRVKAKDNAWQLPQGGIGFGETPEQALHRELGEELGLSKSDIGIEATSEDWLVYALPNEYRNKKAGWGQVQKWFLCRLIGARQLVRVDQVEFAEERWVNSETLIASAVSFRRVVYQRLVDQWQL